MRRSFYGTVSNAAASARSPWTASRMQLIEREANRCARQGRTRCLSLVSTLAGSHAVACLRRKLRVSSRDAREGTPTNPPVRAVQWSIGGSDPGAAVCTVTAGVTPRRPAAGGGLFKMSAHARCRRRAHAAHEAVQRRQDGFLRWAAHETLGPSARSLNRSAHPNELRMAPHDAAPLSCFAAFPRLLRGSAWH